MMSSSKNHFLIIDEVKMRSKKSAGTSKRKNDKAIASDSNYIYLGKMSCQMCNLVYFSHSFLLIHYFSFIHIVGYIT
jgi:hypothetical protein